MESKCIKMESYSLLNPLILTPLIFFFFSSSLLLSCFLLFTALKPILSLTFTSAQLIIPFLSIVFYYNNLFPSTDYSIWAIIFPCPSV